MAKPARNPKTGRFVRKNAPQRRAARKATARKATTTRRIATRSVATRRTAPRRTYKRNPKAPDIAKMLTAGIVTAAEILVGKAAVRSIPDLMGLPKEGNVGLAVQCAVALGLGYVADMFLPIAGPAILAGGLTAPLETAIVAYDVPWLGQALAPVTQAQEVGAYVMSRNGLPALPAGVSRYPQLRGYRRAGMGSYVEAQDSGVYSEGMN